MKKLSSVIFSFFICGYFCAQKPVVAFYRVEGKVTQTSSYCGGAAPTQEMMDTYNTPVKYVGKVFYVRRGKVNDIKQPIILKFISDSLGNFSFKLPRGNYIIIQKEQVKTLNFKTLQAANQVSLDKQCLKEWWKKPYMLLEIKDKPIASLNFNFHQQCFITGDLPCRNYDGPLPP